MHKRRDSYMAYGLNKYGKTSHMYRLLSLAEIVLTEPEMTEKKKTNGVYRLYICHCHTHIKSTVILRNCTVHIKLD